MWDNLKSFLIGFAVLSGTIGTMALIAHYPLFGLVMIGLFLLVTCWFLGESIRGKI